MAVLLKLPAISYQLPARQLKTGSWQLEAGGWKLEALHTSSAFVTTRATIQRLRLLSGRVSMMATRSPILAVFVSSCARNFDVRRSVLPYISLRTCHSTATTQLFCILSLTTTPTFSDFAAIGFLRATKVAPYEALGSRFLALGQIHGHACPCLCFSLITVLIRARSRRVKRSFPGASSWP